MQWDNSMNAGFTTGKPWIKLNEIYREVNVSKELQQKNSLLNTYKSLLALRNTEKTLQYGSYDKLERNNNAILFTRSYKDTKITVIINFGTEMSVDIPAGAKILMGDKTLKPNEFLIYRTTSLK